MSTNRYELYTEYSSIRFLIVGLSGFEIIAIELEHYIKWCCSDLYLYNNFHNLVKKIVSIEKDSFF